MISPFLTITNESEQRATTLDHPRRFHQYYSSLLSGPGGSDRIWSVARELGGDAVSWLNLQAIYDLKTLPNRDEIIRQI